MTNINLKDFAATTEMVKRLVQETNMPIIMCMKAAREHPGDYEKAKDAVMKWQNPYRRN
jgi:translation elongation factor EF-Ts